MQFIFCSVYVNNEGRPYGCSSTSFMVPKNLPLVMVFCYQLIAIYKYMSTMMLTGGLVHLLGAVS